ncbi:hypothetical protein Ae717Ps2_7138c [Pseudonocardia sp. Ae717_Ps2]|nr:hypothetical protein Ae717Ps2_7138c [Pseudonocardia sp. Ae717_Ps2]
MWEELPAPVRAPLQGEHADRAGLDPPVATGPLPGGRPVIFQGSARSRASSVGWLALTVIR